MVSKLDWKVFDPGYSEGDIKASIADSAQSHIKWIYDCLLAKLELDESVRLNRTDRDKVKEVAFDCYKEYVTSFLSSESVSD